LEQLTKSSDCIILLDNSNLKEKIINFGFTIDKEEDQLIVLKKQIG
jgi:hypothetical protein